MKLLYVLILVSFSGFSFSQTWHPLLIENNLPAQAVAGIASAPNGDVWFVSGSDGAYCYSNNSITHITYADGILGNTIKAVTCDAMGRAWFGFSNGISCWYNGHATNYNIQNGMQAQNVLSLTSSPGSILWIGTTNGLIRFDGFSFTHYTVTNGLPSNSIRTLAHDGTNLWIGTYYGLTKFDGTNFINYTTANGLPSNMIRAIYCASPTETWIGTPSGAALYNGSTFQLFTTAQGLVSDSVFSLSGDASGNIWMGHEFSVTRYDGSTFTNFGSIYVYPSESVNCLHVSGDDLYIGSDIDCIKTKRWVVKNQREVFLETSKIRANINNTGGLFMFDLVGEQLGLEYPIDSGTYTTFNSNYWFGGLDPMQNLHIAAGRYYDCDFFSGPVNTNGLYDDTYDSLYNRLWFVTKADIQNHIQNWNQPGYQMPDAIKNWPSLSAPYFDSNGNFVYEPDLGDYPLIRGDRSVLTVNNDLRHPHSTGGEPLKAEIATLYWVYDSADEALQHTIFVHMYVTNYNSYPLEKVYMGIQSDFDIGQPYDDFLGCDPSLSCFYAYNGDDNDQYYGTNIPAQGLVFLSSPLYSCLYYNNGGTGAMTDPQLPMDYYYNMKGFWKDGTPYTYGDDGYGGLVPTQYVFDGDPVTGSGWSEVSENNTPGDRRGLGSIGPFTLDPGKGICIDFAYVTGRDSTGNNLLSITKMKEYIADVIQMYNASSFHCDTIHINIPTGLDIDVADVVTCPGDSVELRPQISALYWPLTFTWSPSAGLSDPGAINPFATVSTTTTYYVTVTDAQGTTDTDSVTVVIDPPQLILDSLYEMCAGEGIMLPVYASYHWFNNNWTGRWYDFYSSGDYWVYVYDDNGCKSDTAFFHVDVVPSPEPELGSGDTLCIGDMTVLSPGPGYYSYTWNNGSTAGSVYVNANMFPPGNYLYSVTVTNAEGCEGSDWTLIRIIDCAFAEYIDPDDVSFAYPNPFSDFIKVEPGSIEKAPYLMELYDATGRLVVSVNAQFPEINVPPVQPGYYILRFTTGSKTVNYRLVKTVY